MQRVEARSTLNARLLAAGRLAELGVTRLVMETTPDEQCLKPVDEQGRVVPSRSS